MAQEWISLGTAPASTNGASVDSYKVEINDKVTPATWSEYTATCDASTGTPFSTRKCTIPMSVLRTTYNYAYGDTITVRVSAHNTYGWSTTATNTGGASIKTEPTDMAAPTVDSQTDTTITISFSTVTSSPANGGVSVTSYSVDYKLAADSTWTTQTGVTSSPQTISSLTPGATYYVAIRAFNIHGYSGRTNYQTVIMRNVPTAPQNVVVAESTDGLGMDITWNAPASTNGASVDSYKVEINDKVTPATWSEYTATCDASTGTPFSTRKCTIPMSVLRTTYNYAYGDTITVRVSAHNTYGWSTTATNTGGASIKTEPTDMAAPTVDSQTDTTITISFSTVTSSPANGGVSVTSYSVDYKLAADSTWTTQTGVTSSPQTISSLTPGATYYVAIRAFNIHGYSGRTNYQTVIMRNVPTAPQNVVVAESTDGLGMDITWNAPASTNGASVDSYKVEINDKVTPATWSEYTATCDASTGTPFSTRKCTIPMSVLRTTYNYAYGDTITVRVSAHNTYGWSTTATNTGGASIKTEPTDMAAPTVDSQTDTTITISFSTVTSSPANGGVSVTSYSVDYKLGRRFNMDNSNWSHIFSSDNQLINTWRYLLCCYKSIQHSRLQWSHKLPNSYNEKRSYSTTKCCRCRINRWLRNGYHLERTSKY